MPGFGPIATGPVGSIPSSTPASGSLQVAEQSAMVAILPTPALQVVEQSAMVAIHQPGLIIVTQSAYVAMLVGVPPPPSSGRRRQYYLM